MDKHVFHKRIAIDYDGTLVENVSPRRDGKATEGLDGMSAREFTEKLRKEGWEILVSTCRPDWQRVEIENNLRSQGIVFDYIFFYQKPGVTVYVDDKGIRFENNWLEIYEKIKDLEMQAVG